MSKDHEHHAFFKAFRDRPVAGGGGLTRIVRPNAFPARIRSHHRRRTCLVVDAGHGGNRHGRRRKAHAVAAERPIALQSDHPQTYTVVPGDTLWSIAQRFLQNPWQWRDIWRQNPQVRNPNRIYPGDVLRFSYDASGKPQLEVAQREEIPLLKLSPQVRVESLTQPIPA